MLWHALAVAELMGLIQTHQLFDTGFALKKILAQIDSRDRREELREVIMHALFPSIYGMGAALTFDRETDTPALAFAARTYRRDLMTPFVIDGGGEFVVVPTWTIHTDHKAELLGEQKGEPSGQILIIGITRNTPRRRDVFPLDGEAEIVGNDAPLCLRFELSRFTKKLQTTAFKHQLFIIPHNHP